MKTKDQINGIKAVVLYILQHFQDGVDYIKLFKIMFFAQRKYLSTYGLCIVDDNFKARPKGPVPSLTYKVVKMVENGENLAEFPDLTDFANSLSVNKKQIVCAKSKPNMDYISMMEKKILDETIDEYKDMDSDLLSEMSHDEIYDQVLERMKDDPQKDVYTLIDIARSGKASDEMIGYLREKQLIKRALA